MTKAPPSSKQLQGDLFEGGPQPEKPSQSNKPKAKKTKRSQTSVIASRLLSIDDITKRYGVGRSTVWRWVKKDGRFPAPVKLTAGTSRWLESELLEFEVGAYGYTPTKPTKTRKGTKPAKGRAS
ncbi:putative DNA-binding transcriptional regulator AlpA [Sulfitobacter undariae]|uniref:Putative DNA-binding transcriptional regulator AlpA n=1 Tax=Sulfitobacter undariae TaxID=1563671 RepID=A0A7W6E7I3_9RHOB|nr:putative DNA-binding transcriptional regulator AlpA [Sulfitobacter undariae]